MTTTRLSENLRDPRLAPLTDCRTEQAALSLIESVMRDVVNPIINAIILRKFRVDIGRISSGKSPQSCDELDAQDVASTARIRV